MPKNSYPHTHTHLLTCFTLTSRMPGTPWRTQSHYKPIASPTCQTKKGKLASTSPWHNNCSLLPNSGSQPATVAESQPRAKTAKRETMPALLASHGDPLRHRGSQKQGTTQGPGCHGPTVTTVTRPLNPVEVLHLCLNPTPQLPVAGTSPASGCILLNRSLAFPLNPATGCAHGKDPKSNQKMPTKERPSARSLPESGADLPAALHELLLADQTGPLWSRADFASS